ncbi:unnamed protein product [Mytilus edulis]|uniref:Uncharacterized protein n=1 Tax=Mytilus edulis TaxID=6550 RepID=A0A8S3R3L1_MYTED|nr:unnamed protein product [Mytilus edulis]
MAEEIGVVEKEQDNVKKTQEEIEMVKVLGKNLTTMNVTLKKEKSELNILVEEIETVKLEQENIRTIREDVEIVRTLADNCLSLKDNVNFKEDTIKKMNTDMENLNVGSSFIQQEHNRFSQKLQEFDVKLIEENNLLNKNSKEVAQLKVTIEQLNVNSTKLDDSFIVLETVIANCSEQMDKCKETAKRMKGIIDDETYLNSSINTSKKRRTECAHCSEQMDKCEETAERMKVVIDDEAYLNRSFKILEKEVEILNTNISIINGDLSTESKRFNNLKLLLDSLQEKEGEINTMGAKLDEAHESVSHLKKIY